MVPLEMLFAFAMIVFPVSLLVPTILANFPPPDATAPSISPVPLAVLYLVPILELWVTVIVAILVLLPQTAIEARTALVVLPLVCLLVTYGLISIAPFMLEVILTTKARRG